MEYVADAQGKTVIVSSSNATPAAGAILAPTVVVDAEAAPAPSDTAFGSAPIAVFGSSPLEEMKAGYARMEADVAAVKQFAAGVMHSGRTDVVAAETLPRSVKIALLLVAVIIYVAGFAVGRLL